MFHLLFSRSFTVAVLLTLLTAAAYWGFHYDIYEGVFAQFMNGNFTWFQDYPIYGYLSHYLTMRVYIWLGAHFSGVTWSSWICLFFTLLSLITFLWYSAPLRWSGWKGFVAGIAFALMFVVDQVLLMDLARYSMLTGVCSLLLFATTTSNNRTARIVATVCFLFASLSRLEAVLPMLVLVGVALWLSRGAIATISRLWLPALLYWLVGMGVVLDLKYSDDYYKQMEPRMEVLLGNPLRRVPLAEMKTPADSMRYEAAVALVYDDTVQLNYAFYKRIIKNEESLLPVGTEGWLEQCIYSAEQLWNSFSEVDRYVWISVLVWAVLIWGMLWKRREGLKWLLYMFLAGLFVLLITFMGGMNERFLEIYLLHALMIPFVLWLRNGLPWWMAGGVFWGGVISLPAHTLVYKSLKSDEVLYSAYHHQLLNSYTGKAVIYDINVKKHLAIKPFALAPVQGFKYVAFHDAAHALHINNLRSFLEQQCSCNAYDYASVFRYFYTNREGVVFLSSPERIALKERFLQKVYQLPYSFELDSTFAPHLSAQTGTYVYRLRDTIAVSEQ